MKDGVETYIVYNNADEDRTVHFYAADGSLLKTVTAPARKLAAISADPMPTSIIYNVEGGAMIPVGGEATVSARLVDQYGAGIADKPVTYSLSAGAPATLDGTIIRVKADVAKGTRFTITLSAEGITQQVELTVNNQYTPVFVITDQYGNTPDAADVVWTVSRDNEAPMHVKGAIAFNRAGHYTVEATSATYGAKATAQVFVTPAMPLISLNCPAMASSAENVGTLPSGATDGNPNERWGSAHTDDEWIVVDLGEDAFISRATLNWEFAYGARYLLQTAPEGCPMTEVDVVYAGETKHISVPAESAWTTAADVHNSSHGERTTILNANGRYLRMKGLERGSAYGYSLYELSVYGIRSSLGTNEVIGIDFALPAVMDCNETLELVPEAYTLGGEVTKGVAVNWASDKEARFDGNAFTPLAPGKHTLTATYGASTSTSATIFVNDVERVDSIALEAGSYTMILGESVRIPFTAINQFMAPFSGKLETLDVKITDADSNTAEGCRYNLATRVFTAENAGDYTIDFGGLAKCTVSARPVTDVNLAYGKEAWASSSENGGLEAKFAVDGKTDTRWGSLFNDDEWMVIDLGKEYKITKVLIYWNWPAYATEYSVLLSQTGDVEDFTEADHVTGYQRTYEPYEPADGLDPVTALPVGERWYTLQGQRVAHPTAPGIYIHIKAGKATKVVKR